jgi:hypothetical protein
MLLESRRHSEDALQECHPSQYNHLHGVLHLTINRRTKGVKSLAYWQLLDLVWQSSSCQRCSEDHLRTQRPSLRQIPRLLHAFVDERIVVLQVCAQPESLQCRPEVILMHAVALRRPLFALVLVDSRSFVFEFGDCFQVIPEEYRSIGMFIVRHLLLRAWHVA